LIFRRLIDQQISPHSRYRVDILLEMGKTKEI